MTYRDRLNSLRTKHTEMGNRINIILERNKASLRMKARLDSTINYLELAVPYRDTCELILNTTKSTYSSYQEGRVKFIENSLDEVIAELFPKFTFKTDLDYSVFRNKIQCDLRLIDAHNNIRYPRITEGGFMKQLIGFCSAIKIMQLMGAKTFLLYEAFSNASSLNKEKMAEIIKGYLDSGIQLILISQSSECYDTLPRREFTLDTNGERCTLIDVKDVK